MSVFSPLLLGRTVSLAVLANTLLCVDCVASAAASSARARQVHQRRVRGMKMSVSPFLLELLPELQHEAQASLRLLSTRTQWCRSVSSHRQKMIGTLRQRLDEAKRTQQQLDTEELRLHGEVSQANVTELQQEAQLKEANSLVDLSSGKHLAERQQFDQLIKAAGVAMRLLRLRLDANSSSDSEVTSSSINAALSRLAEVSEARLFVQGEEMSHSNIKELMRELVALDAQLRADLAESDQDLSHMTRKLHTAQGRLKTAILQAQSQVAIAKMEMAERHRRHARLDGEVLSVSALLQAVEASDKAVSSDCNEEGHQHKQLGTLISTEVDAVKNILGRLPSRDVEWLVGASSDDSSQPSTVVAAAPSFLEVAEEVPLARTSVDNAIKSLGNLSHAFPEQSAWYEEAAQQLSTADDAPSTSESTVAKDEEEEANPLQNIQDFVASDTPQDSTHSTSMPFREDRVRETYTALLDRVLEKQRATSNRSTWCTLVSKSIAADTAALQYSLRQTDARLQLARSQISDYESMSQYEWAQGKTIEQQSTQFHDLSLKATQNRRSFIATLGARLKQLSALVVVLDQKTTPAEQETTRQMSNLLGILEHHRSTLQAVAKDSAVKDADKRILTLFSRHAQYINSRILELKSEARSLVSLSRSRARALSGSSSGANDAVNAAVGKLCGSPGSARPELQSLKQQEEALRSLLSTHR